MNTLPIEDLTIIIPVFGAIVETLECLLSLQNSDANGIRTLVLDDGSPGDESERLKKFCAGHANLEFHQNFRNRGYTNNIALGLRQIKTSYVCILNSDTIVPPLWVAHLLNPLKTHDWLAATGPLSNAASYQSIPQIREVDGAFSVNNGLGQTSPQRKTINAVLGHMFTDQLIDVPVLNGFCTMFRHADITRAGGFDRKTFPKGYGEENDLCVRLRANGQRLAVVPTCFVHHQKSASFGSARRNDLAALGSAAMKQKFHKPLVRALSDQLENTPTLANIRQFAKAGEDLWSLPVENTDKLSGDGSWCPSEVRKPKTLNLGHLDGPCQIEFEDRRYRITADIPAIKFPRLDFKAGKRFCVSLPKGLSLAVCPELMLHSTLCALTVLSQRQEIWAGRWEMPEPRPSWTAILAQYQFNMLYFMREDLAELA